MYYFLKKEKGREKFISVQPGAYFSLIFWRLDSIVACTPIAHLDSTWTAGCLLVWGAGA